MRSSSSSLCVPIVGIANRHRSRGVAPRPLGDARWGWVQIAPWLLPPVNQVIQHGLYVLESLSRVAVHTSSFSLWQEITMGSSSCTGFCGCITNSCTCGDGTVGWARSAQHQQRWASHPFFYLLDYPVTIRGNDAGHRAQAG